MRAGPVTYAGGMCGRFAASQSTQEIVDTFLIEEVVDEAVPDYNVAPTDPVAAVVERVDKATGEGVRKLVTPRWGLVPSWSKTAAGGARMINARSETVATKPAFAAAFAKRRCLIPADGYYEWTPGQRDGKPYKQPWYLHPDAAAPGALVMAGLYEFWRNPDDDTWLTTCTIITTQATDALGHIHDRMPMVIEPADWGSWLDPLRTDAAEVLPLLRTPADLRSYEVSTLVNSVRNDGPELIEPWSQ